MKRMIAVLLVGMLFACGCTANTEKTEPTEAPVAEQTEGAETVTGRIESIDAAGITLSLLPDMPQGQGNPPDMPQEQGNPPEMPQGQGNPPDMPQGQGGFSIGSCSLQFAEGVTFADESGNAIERDALQAGDKVTVTLNADGKAISVQKTAEPFAMGGPGGGPGGAAPTAYTGVRSFAQDGEIANETVASTGADESAVLIDNGAIVTVRNSTVTRVSQNSTGGDSASFYGVGAAMLVTDGTLTVENCAIDTDGAGGAGVFAYGSGTATVRNTSIQTKQGTSGGLHVAGGGTLYAENCTVETDGGSSAAIRSDRGGGTMTVDGGSYTANGSGSPAVYCTADITVKNAALTATGSEAICIEGKNSLTLVDCTLSGNMPDLSQNDCTWTVILYQSMSGDSEIGTASFSMTGGKLISGNGGVFYTTNTSSEFLLENVEITASEACPFLLKCTGNRNARGWGREGANGAQCVFTAVRQQMAGSILWDSISTLSVQLTEGSVWTGAFLKEDGAEGGSATLVIDAGSTWIVTGDSVLTSLENRGTIVDADGNAVTVRTASGKVLAEGTSAYTVTVSEG